MSAQRRKGLGGMKVTSGCFGELTEIVKEISESCCNGRIVSLLEGGYNLKALADSVETHILGLQE